MKEKYCPRCNGLKSASEKFCSQCGVELIDLPRCKYCQSFRLPIDKFCGMCGKPIEKNIKEGGENVATS